MARCLLTAIFSFVTICLPMEYALAQGTGGPKKPFRSFAPGNSGLGGQATNSYNPSGNSDWGQPQSQQSQQSQQGQFQTQPPRQQNRSLGGTIGSAVMGELFQDYPQNNNWNGQQNGRPQYNNSSNYPGYGGTYGNSYQPNSYNSNGYQQWNLPNGNYQNSYVAPYPSNSYPHTHVVTRPAPPAPKKTYSNKPIRLFVPEDQVGILTYQLLADSEIYDYEMEPGSEQEFPHDRDYKVSYDRGDGQRAKYQIVGGTAYKFKKDSAGFWQLYAVAQ